MRTWKRSALALTLVTSLVAPLTVSAASSPSTTEPATSSTKFSPLHGERHGNFYKGLFATPEQKHLKHQDEILALVAEYAPETESAWTTAFVEQAELEALREAKFEASLTPEQKEFKPKSDAIRADLESGTITEEEARTAFESLRTEYANSAVFPTRTDNGKGEKHRKLENIGEVGKRLYKNRVNNSTTIELSKVKTAHRDSLRAAVASGDASSIKEALASALEELQNRTADQKADIMPTEPPTTEN